MCRSVYVDGSFRNGIISGAIIFVGDEKISTEEFYFSVRNDQLSKHRNISGEILATMYAIYYAVENSIHCLKIYHDYEGIGKWASDEWKAKTEIAHLYKSFLAANRSVTCQFIKVDAHSGDKYNSRADTLARFALNTLKSNIDIEKFMNHLSQLY